MALIELCASGSNMIGHELNSSLQLIYIIYKMGKLSVKCTTVGLTLFHGGYFTGSNQVVLKIGGKYWYFKKHTYQ